MKTIENNKLIAEFMGLIESSIDKKYWTEKTKEGIGKGELVELKYHTSWDWLMPVVETCYHNGAEGKEIGDITHALLDCDLKSTYIAVVQFINQYNNQQL